MKFKMSMFSKMISISGFVEVIMLLMLIFAMYAFYLNEKKDKYVQMETLLTESSNRRLAMLAQRDSNFAEIFRRNTTEIFRNLRVYDTISSELNNDRRVEKLDSLKSKYSSYINNYKTLINKCGLNENQGIEGQFRESIHSIEEYLKKIDNEQIYLLLLQARRREKDFIIRGRQEYTTQVVRLIDSIDDIVLNKDIYFSLTEKNKILSLTNEYKSSFKEYVNVKSAMSKSEAELLMIEAQMRLLISELVSEETMAAEQYKSTLLPLFLFSILISILSSVLVARSITKPLVKLKHATIKIANGDFKIKVKVESKDEIGDLANFFNIMTENIRKANETIMSQQTTLNSQYSELKRINATRDKFFSIIAHDLRNPISAFMNVSDFLTQTFQELSRDEIKDFLDDVNTSAKSLYELLENLLLWSRSQRGLIPYHPISLDTNSMIQSNLELLKFNAENKCIDLTYQANENLTVFADPNMLNTIIRNLITNAIKFTNDNGKVTVKCEKNEKFATISICDTGVGIPEANIKTMFQLEGSVTTAGTKQEAGSGLGLILCREFVEKHGGYIGVESEINVGSRFYFTIPLV